MEYTDKEYCLEVWGDMACFTRPELKVERVSYDVITPSAARAIFEAVFWKRAIHWQITKIEVLNPIKWISVRRNEVGKLASINGKSIYIDETSKKNPNKLINRQQRNSLFLREVKYRIWAKLEYQSVQRRIEKGAVFAHPPRHDENPMKYYSMFERRASKGQCFTQPYFGCRECTAYFRLIDPITESLKQPISETRDLGLMLYDKRYIAEHNVVSEFFHAKMENGVINCNRKEIEIWS